MVDTIHLTEDEKRYISAYLKNRSKTSDAIFHYGTYILPSLLFALYALWKEDFVAALVAYVALLIVAIIYLSYAKSSGDTFRSILEKFEAVVSNKPEASQ
jgi:VIT1/CCC1 family predicted Fe2+/Mn2+ transporter